MRDVVIEKLTKEDLDEFVKIYDDNHGVKTNKDNLDNQFEKLNINEAYYNIVAKINNKVVGMATVIKNYDIVEELKPFLTVWNLGVHKDYRRMKIATKLLEHIYSYAKENGCAFIALLAQKDNIAAQKLYNSAGYEEAYGYFKMIGE